MGAGVSNRKFRYGGQVRGWDWRTNPERLSKADERRKQLGMNRTQFLEYCIDKELGMNNPTFAIQNLDGCNVATVTYADGTTFTTSDWQGPQPASADEIEQYNWSHVNASDPANTADWTPAIIVLGWPRFSV
jgi:hypothetical protein